MNYTLNSVKVKSNWFDHDVKINKFQRMGYKGFNIYLSMFKFRLHNQKHEHVFITSISLLRSVTGYTNEEIIESLKLFKRYKILKFDGLSRWDYLYDTENKIKDDRIIMCHASDIPELIKVKYTEEEKKAKRISFDYYDQPKTEEDNYISIDLRLMQHYLDIGLNDRYFGLYCLLNKWNNNTEGKSWMSISKMAETLGYDKDNVNHMIRKMNRSYLLLSVPRKSNKGGEYFDHYICESFNSLKKFKKDNEEQIKSNIKRWDKSKSKHKKKAKVENKPVESELAFGNKGSKSSTTNEYGIVKSRRLQSRINDDGEKEFMFAGKWMTEDRVNTYVFEVE